MNIYLNGALYLKRKPQEKPLSYKGLSNIHQLLISEEGMFLRQRSCTGSYFDELIPVTQEQLDTEQELLEHGITKYEGYEINGATAITYIKSIIETYDGILIEVKTEKKS